MGMNLSHASKDIYEIEDTQKHLAQTKVNI